MKRERVHIVAGKLDYARGKRPPVDCILCAVAANEPGVDNLMVFRGQRHFITLNLYPYNPGHLMVVPLKHCEDIRQLDTEEAREMHALQLLCLEVLDKAYSPGGFNIGYNMGPTSGGSIPHLHLQVVPRYQNEIGFFEILSESRVIVEYPHITRDRLSSTFDEIAPAFLKQHAP